jgi:potassium channel
MTTMTTTKERNTLLDSCKKGDLEEVWRLLEAGGDIHARDADFSTCLHFAASREGQDDLIRLLIERGAGVNEVNLNGNTPLHRT